MMRVPHPMFLFGVGKDTFNGFAAHSIGCLAFGGVAEIFRLLDVIRPKMPQIYLLAAPALCASGQVWTGSADFGITLELSVPFPRGGYIWQHLIAWAEHTVVVLIVDKLVRTEKASLSSLAFIRH